MNLISSGTVEDTERGSGGGRARGLFGAGPSAAVASWLSGRFAFEASSFFFLRSCESPHCSIRHHCCYQSNAQYLSSSFCAMSLRRRSISSACCLAIAALLASDLASERVLRRVRRTNSERKFREKENVPRNGLLLFFRVRVEHDDEGLVHGWFGRGRLGS